MHLMAASNAFGAFAFNACFSLGFPWVVIGLYSDVLPPSDASWASGVIGFGSIGVAMLSVCLCGLRLTRELGVMLLLCYAVYLVLIVSGATVMLQSARGSLQLLVNFPAVPSTAAAFP